MAVVVDVKSSYKGEQKVRNAIEEFFTDDVVVYNNREVNGREYDICLLVKDVCVFIIEVKGIGGTSTDAECSQVAKHRRRREKEHRDKEILPIYIVNHQRYIRPSLRQNPPFSDNQIENGIFTKKETRESLDKWGLISLLPKNLIRVGIYEEYFKKPKAGILTLNNVKLEVGKMIYAKKDGKWICTSIVSIQLNDKDVDQVDNGEVGIVTDIELEKGYEIFVKIE